jgi:hypothetical protein
VKELLAGRLEGQPQDLQIGREYRAADHGLRAELRARRAIRGGLIRRYVAGLSEGARAESAIRGG